MILLKFNNNRVNKYTSYYTYKLFKKFLIMKLLLSIKLSKIKSKYYLEFLGLKKGIKIIENQTKIYYNRNELIPFRLLRFLFYISSLKKNVISKIIPAKLTVYNGKEDRLIDIHRGLLSKLIRCKFTFGSFIFTRALYVFRRKKKKKNLKKKK